jgi:hypothetical protein
MSTKCNDSVKVESFALVVQQVKPATDQRPQLGVDDRFGRASIASETFDQRFATFALEGGRRELVGQCADARAIWPRANS